MIDIDRTVALRSKGQLLELVQAVAEAEAVDEAEWIEWKGTLDLASKDGQFHVARAVLGLANRMPDDAARWCVGYAYLLIGVQPGDLAGIEAVDGADFTPGVDAYTGGGDGPRWEPAWLRVGDRMVLVVIVDPPRWGDPPWRLRRAHGARGGAAANTVFVRRGSVTAPASPDQTDRLATRAATRPVDDVAVDITAVGEPVAWLDRAALRTHLEAIADQRVAEERAVSEEVRNPPTSGPVRHTVGGNTQRTIMEQIADTTAFFAVRHTAAAMERRSWAQYEGELAGWREQLLETLSAQYVRAFHTAGHGQVQLVVANPTGRHLDDVEITVRLPAGVGALDDPPDADDALPDPPSRWGSDVGLIPHIGPLASFDAGALDLWRDIPALRAPGADSIVVDGDGDLVATVRHLRQYATVQFDPVWLHLHAAGDIDLPWIARIRNPETVLTGTLHLALAATPLGPAPTGEAGER